MRVTYKLEQPDMHATHRKYAPAVDQFNKLALQLGIVTDISHTKNVWSRLWAATLAFIESNRLAEERIPQLVKAIEVLNNL